MAAERVYGGTSLVDVLDRILDKGLVIDVWVRVSVVGLELITVEARVVVASVDTYLKYAQAIGLTPLASRPPLEQSEGALGSGQSAPRGPAREPARLVGGPDEGGGLLEGLTQPVQSLLGGGQGSQSGGQPQGAQGGQQNAGLPPDLVNQLQSILSQLQQGQQGQNGQGANRQLGSAAR